MPKFRIEFKNGTVYVGNFQSVQMIHRIIRVNNPNEEYRIVKLS